MQNEYVYHMIIKKKMFKFDLMFVIIIKGIKIKNTVLIRENEDTKRVI